MLYSQALFPAVRAVGTTVYCVEGFDYIDMACGLSGVLLGYGHPRVSRAAMEQIASGVLAIPGYLGAPHAEEFQKRIQAVYERPVNEVHVKGSTGGSTAVEQAIKHALQITGKKRVIRLRACHHGQTLGIELMNRESLDELKPTLDNDFWVLPSPDCSRCPLGLDATHCDAECLDEAQSVLALDVQQVGAVIFERVAAASGCLTWPEPYWKRIKRIGDDAGALFISDEVHSFGRLDHNHPSTCSIVPDMVVLGKGLSGIGLPGCAAVLFFTDAIREVERHRRSLTWGGSAIALAVMCATLEELAEVEIAECSRSINRFAQAALSIASRYFPNAKLRGSEGLVAIDLGVDAKNFGRHIETSVRAARVLSRCAPFAPYATLDIRPPIIFSERESEEALVRLEVGLRSAAVGH